MKCSVHLATLLILTTIGLYAQSPTTTYPYLYDNFTEGTVVMDDGGREQRRMNVHLRAGRLHYIDNGIIREAFLTDVAVVEIGSDVFLPVNASMMRVAAKNDKGCVVEELLGDFESAREGSGAYGASSSSSATMKLTSVQTDSQINQNYMNILNEKEDGVALDIIKNYYVVTPQYRIRASRKEFEEALPADKAPLLKGFLKEYKIKWRNPQSLLSLIDFLAE